MDPCTGLGILQTADYHALAKNYALADDPFPVDGGTDLHRPNFDLVVIRDDSDLKIALKFGDGGFWHQQSVVQFAGYSLNSPILTGPKHIAGIWK